MPVYTYTTLDDPLAIDETAFDINDGAKSLVRMPTGVATGTASSTARAPSPPSTIR
jgi:hypothetical protein